MLLLQWLCIRSFSSQFFFLTELFLCRKPLFSFLQLLDLTSKQNQETQLLSSTLHLSVCLASRRELRFLVSEWKRTIVQDLYGTGILKILNKRLKKWVRSQNRILTSPLNYKFYLLDSHLRLQVWYKKA